MNQQNRLASTQIIILGLIDYLLDAIDLTNDKNQSPEDRYQVKNILLTTINTNLSTELLADPKVGQSIAEVLNDPNFTTNFTQNLDKLTKDNSLPEIDDLSKLLASHSQRVLVEFAQKTISDSTELVTIIKEALS